MKLRSPIATAVAVPLILLLLLFLMLLFVSDRELKGVISRGLEKEGLTFHAEKFSKALPLGVKIHGLTIASTQGEMLKADDIAVRVQLLPLFMGKVRLSVTGRIGNGTIQGSIQPQQKGDVDIQLQRIRLQDLPVIATATGAMVQGDLTGKLRYSNKLGKGELKLEVTGAELRGIKMGALPLPDSSYRSIQCMVRASGGKIMIESFTLEGEGLYARLKGDLPLVFPLAAAPLNMVLELMPKPDFMENQKLIFLLLVKYQDSPGHYALPIRGSLGKPSVF